MKPFLVLGGYDPAMPGWHFLTNHARVLLCIARDPGVRLREIAATLDITERTAFGVVADLTEAGYVIKERDGRRNRYEIQHHLPLPDPASEERTVGELLELLGGHDVRRTARPKRTSPRSAALDR